MEEANSQAIRFPIFDDPKSLQMAWKISLSFPHKWRKNQRSLFWECYNYDYTGLNNRNFEGNGLKTVPLQSVEINISRFGVAISRFRRTEKSSLRTKTYN